MATTYADFTADSEYQSKQSGSAIEVLIVNSADPSDVIIGAVTGINNTEEFETIPIEEAGEDGVDEIVQGRHTGSMSLPAFWTPAWNDTLPTRQTFIGKEYVIIERFGEDRPNAGVVVNAYVGCKLNRFGQSHNARGAKTVDLAFVYTRRYNGAEWSALSGS